MSDLPYSTREIDQLFKAADERADEFHGRLMEKLDRIERQTVKTNGRVTKLERYMLVVSTATSVLIFLKFPELKGLIGLV